MEQILDNTIIFDGKKEYFKVDILSDERLYKYLNSYFIIHFPKSFINEIVKENGIFYITTNLDLSLSTLTLKNISIELREKFDKIYK